MRCVALRYYYAQVAERRKNRRESENFGGGLYGPLSLRSSLSRPLSLPPSLLSSLRRS